MRHPDEIKKFVKKNGTYMLKKAKNVGGSSKTPSNESLDDSFSTTKPDDANPDDSGVDEPSLSSVIAKKTSTTNNSANNSSFSKSGNAAGVGGGGSGKKQPQQVLQVRKKKQSSSEDNEDFGDENDIENDEQSCIDDENEANEDSEEATSKTTSPNMLVPNSQNQQIMNNFYNELYPFMYSAQMAMFSRMMTNQNQQSGDEMNAAQYLMNLRCLTIFCCCMH